MRSTLRQKSWEHLWGDAALVVASVIFSLYWLRTGAIERFVGNFGELEILGPLMAGLFFTSIFTTPVAIVVLGTIGQAQPIFLVSAVGAIGAMLGDLIIFRFVKDALVQDVRTLVSLAHPHRWKGIFHLKFFRWFIAFLGALVIASPLPDELGIVMMGLSKTNNQVFALVSLVMNFIGILIIVTLARSIVA